MPLIQHNNAQGPLSRALTDIFGAEDQRRIFEHVKPDVYVYSTGTYLHLLTTSRGNHQGYVWDMIEPDVLQRVRDGQAEIVFDLALEIVPIDYNNWWPELVEIYETAIRFGIDPSRITMANCNPKSGLAMKRVADSLSVPSMKAFAADFVFAFYFAHFGRGNILDSLAALERSASLPEALFLMLNRKVKPHRVAFLIALSAVLEHNRLEYSLVGARTSDIDRQLIAKYAEKAKSLYLDSCVDLDAYDIAATRIISEFPKYITEPETGHNSHTMAQSIEDTELYARTAINIVSETTFGSYETSLITEKVLKPILMRQPFLILGDAGALERVRNLGFSSFSPYIDETYDTLENPRERFNALLAEATRIAALDPEALAHLHGNLTKIAEANARHLRNGFLDRFRETVMDGLHACWN